MDNKKPPILKNYEFVSANGIPCNLGFGAYGSVQLGKCLKTGETVAIKRIGRKIALNEVEVHMKLNHPNIIRMLDYYFDERQECTYIVLEYAENGTLFDCIRDNALKDKRMVRSIFMSVCDAIDYMHSKNIMHRDIKPQNVLLDRNNTAKVCDFGFAAKCEPRMTLCGTSEYMAPEMILRKPYNHKIDIWGLGILLFEIIEGKAPFQGTCQEEVLENMKKPIYFSKKFTPDEIELVHRILKVDPNERPQINQICKSPCLRNSYRSSQDSNSGKKSTQDKKYINGINEEKRSTFDEKKSHRTNQQKRSTAEEEKLEKKIKIIEVIDLKSDKVEKIEKSQKKNSYNIEITSIRDLHNEPHSATSQHVIGAKGERVEKPISTGSIPIQYIMGGKEKISLKKVSRKS